jgi:hypothetical protein
MLGFLEMLPGNLLGKWKPQKRLDEAVFTIIARLPMKWMEMGVPQCEEAFDVQLHSFLEELRHKSPPDHLPMSAIIYINDAEVQSLSHAQRRGPSTEPCGSCIVRCVRRGSGR